VTNPSSNPPTPAGQINWSRVFLTLLLIGLVTFGVVYFTNPKLFTPDETAMSGLVEMINTGKIDTLTVTGDEIEAKLKDETIVHSRKEPGISIYETLSLLGVDVKALNAINVKIVGQNPGEMLFNVLIYLGPFLLIAWFASRMFGAMRAGQDQAMGFGRTKARTIQIDRPVVTFEDVAGTDEAREEVSEIVEFLKDPQKFIKLGARVPKGVLMIGPPGTGKTLLARAIAGEAGVSFMNISGSEFVEMFVGVGASRVRDLFEKARQVQPCIIFIDEIDAVGRMRGTGLGGGHDEREQTLNQILVEMDGFDTDTNIIVIAATNRADVLDPALLRPGRFDRKVYLTRPDVLGREQILKVHTRGKPVRPDVDLNVMAKLTPGFSGADIENLVNEAAILAARRNLHRIGMPEFQSAMEKIVAGPERRTRVVSPEERKVVAYHEAGHAVVMYHLTHSDPVHKITIIPHGMAGGFTQSLPESADSGLLSREQLEDRIVGLLGGRAAEELTFKQITTGASSDLENATAIAKAMVTRYGMSDKLGLRVYGDEGGTVFLGRSLGEQRDYSDDKAREIDAEVSTILSRAYGRARKLLTENRKKLVALAKMLLELETVDRTQFETLMVAGA
jgi:cell division protease FtsH